MAEAVAHLPWVADGLTNLSSSFEERVQQLADPQQSWLLDSLTFDALLNLAQRDLATAQVLVACTWVNDGVTEAEREMIQSFTLAADGDNRAFTRLVVRLPWVRDGVTPAEQRAVAALLRFGAIDEVTAQFVFAFRWLEDEATGNETTLLETLLQLAETDSATARHIAAFSWIADGDSISDAEQLAILHVLQLARRDLPLAQRVAALSWVGDDITGAEQWAMSGLSQLAGRDLALAQRVAALPWVGDGITDTESEAIRSLASIDPEKARALLDIAGNDSRAETIRILSVLAFAVVLEISAESPTQLMLTWSLNVDDATGIFLYRDGELVAEVAADSESYVDTGLDPNTRYDYRLEVERRDGPDVFDHNASVTLVHPPRLDFQMRTHLTGFQVPIVDELNPGHTEYKVTVSQGGSNPVVSDWSSSKCRTFDGLRPNTGYDVAVAARNLDGIQAHATNLARGDDLPERVYSTGSRSTRADPWVAARAGDIGRIYGLTEGAVEWINDDLHIERKRAEPGKFAYYRGGYIEVGHTNPWNIMHEVMHAFWSHWDGFAEPCDQTNVYTFWVDTAQFILDFREYDRAETSNPLEPWRPYYDWMVLLLEDDTPDDEDLWTVLERREFHRLKGLFFHLLETSLPAHSAGKIDLIPPPLQRYVQGFLEEGSSTTWSEEQEWYSRLNQEDRRLWQLITHGVNFWTPLDLQAHAPVQDAAIDEALRKTLMAAERQQLVDLINTLGDVGGSQYWDRDPHFWDHYITSRIALVPLYLNELDSSVGIELDETTLDVVVESLQAIWGLHFGKEEWADIHGLVSGIEGLSQTQRTALLSMIEIRRPE